MEFSTINEEVLRRLLWHQSTKASDQQQEDTQIEKEKMIEQTQFCPSTVRSNISLLSDEQHEVNQKELEECLIEEIHEDDCLWNTKSSSFKDNRKKLQALQNISNKVEKDGRQAGKPNVTTTICEGTKPNSESK